MLNKFFKGAFPHEYDPTDTVEPEEFASMRYEWLRDGVDVLLPLTIDLFFFSFYNTLAQSNCDASMEIGLVL